MRTASTTPRPDSPMRSRHSRRLSAVAVAAVLALLAAGCGARLSDEQLAAATRGGAVQPGQAQPLTPGAAETTATTTAATETGGTGGGLAGPAAGPSASGPGGGGSAAGPAASGGCAPGGGATDVGVTDTVIKIGNVSVISGPVPRLGQTAQFGTKAYVNYINSQGGVCGRKLQLVAADDRLDTGANRSETERLKSEVFAFAGSFSVVDDGGASVLAGTDIPDVGLAISDQRIEMPNNFSPNPIDPTANSNGTQKMMAWFKANRGVATGAVVYPAQAAAKKRALAYESDMQSAGIQTVVKAEVAVTQTDYNGVATQIKNAKADLVITALDVNGMARLAQALKQQGYQPKVPYYGAQAYGRKFLKLAGDAAEGTILGLGYSIFEDAPAVPMMQTFLDWYQRSNPGADIDFFALQSWVATDMLVQALKQVGSKPTRAAVTAKLKSFTDFDGSGMLAPHVNPGQKKPSPCFMIATVQGGQWKRVFPARGFQC